MDTSESFALIETNFKHLFATDRAKNSITLRPGLGNIPTFTLVCVEGGEFLMGENGKTDDEKPPHRVSVNSFFMAEVPVTQELYRSITGKSPSQFEGVNHPVEQVTWYNAVAFCNQLNKLLKLPKPYSGKDEETKCNFRCTAFRLPTEAEWEYAARGGAVETHGCSSLPGNPQQFEYAGSGNLNKVAWYEKNNEYETKPVGLKYPNRLGLYDMSGNVFEWCWDRYDDYYYDQCCKNGLTRNPIGPENGSSRVLRGGSWGSDAGSSRVAYRNSRAPGADWDDRGFRILLAL
ncbi:MAG: formylglycine-generating enzyme family protein [Mariniphaga sp.]